MGEASDGGRGELGAATRPGFVADNRGLVRAVEEAGLVETAVAECRRVVPHEIPDGTTESIAVFSGVDSGARLRQIHIPSHAAVIPDGETVLVVRVQIS